MKLTSVCGGPSIAGINRRGRVVDPIVGRPSLRLSSLREQLSSTRRVASARNIDCAVVIHR